jgi:cytochrome c
MRKGTAMKAALPAIVLALWAPIVAGQATGDVVRGRQLYENRCIACHSIDASRVGPAHKGVVGRRAGGVAGYEYSPAVKRSGIVWTASTLDRWLTDPEKTIPGQRMGYSVPEAKDRADLIAWLAKNS